IQNLGGSLFEDDDSDDNIVINDEFVEIQRNNYRRNSDISRLLRELYYHILSVNTLDKECVLE
ncbi:MAG: hypothetical protein LBT43_14030, partial [Prevotella sp.]|nr:hypothetical protein [Prevotella sp.]